jgi:hypothetical protein
MPAPDGPYDDIAAAAGAINAATGYLAQGADALGRAMEKTIAAAAAHATLRAAYDDVTAENERLRAELARLRSVAPGHGEGENGYT